MPIYEYVCDTCGSRFERRQSFRESPLESCPAGHQKVRRLISRPAVHFKGSGFYVTDSKESKNSSKR